MMFAREEGVPVDPAALGARIRSAVAEVVGKQAAAGIDIVSDGEVSKPSYATYVKDRLEGFAGASHPLQYQDLVDFPGMARRVFGDPGRSRRKTPACTGPIAVRDRSAAQVDVDNLRAALGHVAVGQAFMSAASPGVISLFFRNDHYPPTRPTCSPSPAPCGTSTRRWRGPGSCSRWTARTWPWAATSSSPP
jgi:5-methyltetrahydropteroyltriglutamate--homocysteine methyltransferase